MILIMASFVAAGCEQSHSLKTILEPRAGRKLQMATLGGRARVKNVQDKCETRD